VQNYTKKTYSTKKIVHNFFYKNYKQNKIKHLPNAQILLKEFFSPK